MKTNKKNLINICTAILVFVILFNVFNNIYFIHQVNMYGRLSSSSHKVSIENYNKFKEGNIFSLLYQTLLFPAYIQAPSPLLFSFLLYPFFGISEEVTEFPGTIYLVILIISTYLLGKELFNRKVGLLSAVLVSFSPYILAHSKILYEDITFVALFTLTLYFFVKSNKFSDIKYTWFFNVSLGLTLLSKFNALFVVIILSFAYITLKLIFDRKDFGNYFSKWNKTNIKHFLISLFIIVISLSIYYINFFIENIRGILLAYGFPDSSSIGSNFLFYINRFPINGYLRTFYFSCDFLLFYILFVISLVFFLFFSKKNKLLILSLIISSNIYHIIILFIFPNTWVYAPRYLLFIKPVYYIVFSFFIVEFLSVLIKKINKKFNIKKDYFYPFVILFIIVFTSFTLQSNYDDDFLEPNVFMTPFEYFKFYKLECNEYTNPDSLFSICDLDSFYETISQNQTTENKGILVFFPFIEDNFNFDSYLKNKNPNLEIVHFFITDSGIVFSDFTKFINYSSLVINGSIQLKRLERFDFIFIFKEVLGPMSPNVFRVYRDQVLDYVSARPTKFILCKKTYIDYYSKNILIYRNNIR